MFSLYFLCDSILDGFESLLHISHLLLSIVVLLHLSCGWANSCGPPGLKIRRDLWSVIGLHVTDLFDSFCYSCTPSVHPCLSCVWLSFCAAAAPGSPAVSAPGPGSANDPPATGTEPTRPPRRHHLLRSLLPLLPAGLSSPTGQGGESISWRQPPRGGRREVRLVAPPPFRHLRSEPPFCLQCLCDYRPQTSCFSLGALWHGYCILVALFTALWLFILSHLLFLSSSPSASQFIVPPLHLLPALLLTAYLLSGKAKSETPAFREAVKLIRCSWECQKYHK